MKVEQLLFVSSSSGSRAVLAWNGLDEGCKQEDK